MDKNKIYCIYCILNTTNHKRYIGQTTNFNSRRNQHISKLRKNKHSNYLLQESWNKCGEASFKFIILKECDKCDLDRLEEYYVFKFNTIDRKFGYNIYGGGTYGKYIPDEAKKKISEHHADVSKENNPFYKKKHSQESIDKFLNNENYQNRKIRGEDNHKCCISEEDVRWIKNYFSDGHEVHRGEVLNIAKKFGVSSNIVSHIKNGYAWKWLN